MKNKQANLMDWKVKELAFKPIDCSVETSKINLLKVELNNDVYKKINFALNDADKQIYHPLSFNTYNKPVFNYQFNIEDKSDYHQTKVDFKNQSISDINSYSHIYRKSFLDKKLYQIQIDNPNDDDNETKFNLGEKDPWVVM